MSVRTSHYVIVSSFTLVKMGLSLSVNVVIISIVFSLLAIVAVALRFKSRRIKRASFGPDDYCIIPALASSFSLLNESGSCSNKAFAVALGVTNTTSKLAFQNASTSLNSMSKMPSKETLDDMFHLGPRAPFMVRQFLFSSRQEAGLMRITLTKY